MHKAPTAPPALLTPRGQNCRSQASSGTRNKPDRCSLQSSLVPPTLLNVALDGGPGFIGIRVPAAVTAWGSGTRGGIILAWKSHQMPSHDQDTSEACPESGNEKRPILTLGMRKKKPAHQQLTPLGPGAQPSYG